jgi:hypothetical protein
MKSPMILPVFFSSNNLPTQQKTKNHYSFSTQPIGSDIFQFNQKEQPGGNPKTFQIMTYAPDGETKPDTSVSIPLSDRLEYLENFYGLTAPTNPYRPVVLDEDREVLETLIPAFIKPDGLLTVLKKNFKKEMDVGKPFLVTDVGNGGNLYPAFLFYGLKQILNLPKFELHLSDKDENALRVIKALLKGRAPNGSSADDIKRFDRIRYNYPAFANVMRKQWNGIGQNPWNDVEYNFFDNEDMKVVLYHSPINDLPKNKYHIATSFYVLNEVSDKKEEFFKSVASFVHSVKPGGIVAGTVGINGDLVQYGGWNTLSSSILSIDDIISAFKKAGVSNLHLKKLGNSDCNAVFYGIRDKS